MESEWRQGHHPGGVTGWTRASAADEGAYNRELRYEWGDEGRGSPGDSVVLC